MENISIKTKAKEQPDSSKKNKHLSKVMTTATFLGYALLLWVDWRIALGVYLIVFAQNIRLNMQEESKKDDFVKMFEELLK